MTVSEQKTLVRCAIQRVFRAGVHDDRNDRVRAIREITDGIVAAGIPVFSTSVLYLPDYEGYGPMLYGETLVTLDGEPQHFELMTRAA